jgi:hypothetical protein
MQITKEDIAALRGGIPEKCSFCKAETLPNQLEPEEAGDWACWTCLHKWAIEDGRMIEASFYERLLKEAKAHEKMEAPMAARSPEGGK